METSNTLDRMATYNFNAPIDTVCFEENSDEEIDLTSSPKAKDIENNEVVIEPYSKSKDNEKNLSLIESQKQIEDGNKKNAVKRKLVTENHEEVESRIEFLETDSSKKSKICNSSNNIDKASESLKTVAKYLTLIMESFHYYTLAVKNVNNTPHDISLTKNSYLTIKNHCFKAAYEHVNSYIMPNENNQAFIQNFLNFTICMANSRIKIDCNKGITELYFEIMKWVKQRKVKDFNDSCKTPILLQHLAEPPVIPNVTITQSTQNIPQHCPNEAEQTRLCIFSSGPPGRQININVDKSLMTNKKQGLVNNLLPQNKAMQQSLVTQQALYNSTHLDNNYGNRHFYSKMMTQQSNLTQPLIPSNGYPPIADNRMPTNLLPPNSLRNVRYEHKQISSSTNFNYYHTTNNFQSNSYYATNNVMQHGNSSAPNTIIHEDGSFQTYKRDYHPLRYDMGVPPPPYPSSVIVHPNQSTQPVTPTHSVLPGLPSGPDLTRSSVSTDSGFVSPVGSKSNTNPIEDIMNDLFELENNIESSRTTAPAQEVCHVCQKRATLMCSACFKTTYCNAMCQRMDWEAHRIFCTPQKGKRR